MRTCRQAPASTVQRLACVVVAEGAWLSWRDARAASGAARSRRAAFVSMVKTADFWDCDDVALYLPRIPHLLSRLMLSPSAASLCLPKLGRVNSSWDRRFPRSASPAVVSSRGPADCVRGGTASVCCRQTLGPRLGPSGGPLRGPPGP